MTIPHCQRLLESYYMRYMYLLVIIYLYACSVDSKHSVNLSQTISQNENDYESLTLRFKEFKQKTLSREQSLSEDVGTFIKGMTSDINKFSQQSSDLKSDFEELLGAGRDLENLLSLAYISMIHYHMFNEISLINPPSSFGEKARLHFAKKIYEMTKPMLSKSRESQLLFTKHCKRMKLVKQCDEFILEHKQDLPSDF